MLLCEEVTLIGFHQPLLVLHVLLVILFGFSSLKKSTAQAIIGHFEGEQADLVVCDGAPDGMFSA